MAGNFEGIKLRNFGIEIEMTGLTRCQAAKAIAKVLGGTAHHEGGTYDKYTVDDEKGREWSIVYDGSIKCVDANGNHASKSYSVELNSPVLGYEDIPLLQEVIRALRHAKGRCGPEYCCGTYLHISADDYTPQQIRNLVNIFASKEDFLWDALQVSSAREGYCSKSDKNFVEQLNQKKPKTIEKIKELWYRGNMNEQYRHYSNTRYHALNLHSYFQHGHYEIRCCNASLHAGEVRAQIVLALAVSNAAMTNTNAYILPMAATSTWNRWLSAVPTPRSWERGCSQITNWNSEVWQPLSRRKMQRFLFCSGRLTRGMNSPWTDMKDSLVCTAKNFLKLKWMAKSVRVCLI